MPHYFFDIHDGIHVRDERGEDLPDLAAVRATAMKIATAYAAKPEMLGEKGGVIVVTVRDDQDETVTNVRLVFDIEDVDPRG